MRKSFVLALMGAAAIASVSSQAIAATLVLDDNSLDNKVKAFSDLGHPDTGSSVFGITDDENALIKFSSNQTIHITPGSGYASITDSVTSSPWLSLLVAPDNAATGFTAFSFSAQFDGTFIGNGNGGQPDPGYLTVTANLLGGGSEIFTFANLADLEFTNQGLKDFLLKANAGQVFSSVQLTSTDPLFEIKQVDIQLSAVPEPATWAMLLAGFGVVGSSMRRRRTRRGASFV